MFLENIQLQISKYPFHQQGNYHKTKGKTKRKIKDQHQEIIKEDIMTENGKAECRNTAACNYTEYDLMQKFSNN